MWLPCVLQLMTFLGEMEKAGKGIQAAFGGAGGGAAAAGAVRGSDGASVASEASLLKGMLSKLRQMY